MAFQILLFFFCILSIAHTNPTNPPPSPKVYEDVKEEPEETIRVARNPKYHQIIHEPPKFDYKAMVQQDPQKIRYAQQQQMDSYIRAYQHEHNLRRVTNPHKHPASPAKTAYDTRPKSENNIQASRQFNSNILPVMSAISETEYSHVKKVDPKIEQSINKNEFSNQKSTGYKVNEDLDGQASFRDAKVYQDQENLLKSTLSSNYLAKHPTYVLANPQLNIDPKLLMQGLQYQLPENHQLAEAGFQPATKTDIEALSSLLGQTPNAQLQGLTELLAQQSAYSGGVTPIPAPEIPQPSAEEISVQPEALLGFQDHTPIKEEIQTEVEIPQITHTHVDTHAHINHEVKILPETKSIYDGHGDNLQYAAQYAFGYKIRDYHSGSNFGHEEVREGDIAKGHYHVLLPDGRLQNVDYWADPSGYHAKVTYSNIAQH